MICNFENLFLPISLLNACTKMNMGGKLKLILWKNYKIRLRHSFLTICEILLPILLFLLLAYGRAKVDFINKQYIESATYVESKSSEEILRNFAIGDSKIYYAPTTPFTNEIIYETQLKMDLPNDILKGFETEEELINYYVKNASNGTVTIAIIFDNSTAYENNPKKLQYKIRSYEKHLKYQTNAAFSKNFIYTPGAGSHKYFGNSFLAIQMALDTCFLQMISDQHNLPIDIYMQEFPYPPHIKDSIKVLYNEVLPLITMWSFLLLCPGVLQRIVEEKASGIKELMKMMGLHSWMLWCGWFLHAFFVNGISLILIVLILNANFFGTPVFEDMDFTVLFVFLILFCCATISFIFAVSTLFKRPTMATIFCFLLIQITYYVPLKISKTVANEDNLHSNMPLRLMFSLLPNIAMVFGYRIIGLKELKDDGLQWNNLFTSPTDDPHDMTMGHVFLILLFDTIFYFCITFYIDSVHPGPYGIPRKWHFIFSNRFGKVFNRTVTCKSTQSEKINKYVEEAPKNLEASIVINDLRKHFHGVNAVNGLSMDIYKDQITILLGHNGAGKTTTMHILTGMVAATSGSVKINNHDVGENMDDIRKSLGLCTQHNLLFSDLTVKEQLMFFAMLRGQTKETAEREAIIYVKKMKIEDKLNVFPEQLSGGMKRKLALGIALVGNAKVLMLDEPTSGLDPESRRDVWNMLQSERQNKTMLITTHFLEEADVLGDRIAIMDHGHLLCYGTSMYLKKQFGTGYHLLLVRDENKFIENNPNDNVDQIKKITQAVSEKIPNVSQGEVKGNSVKFALPTEDLPKFSGLFKTLEDKQTELGITGMGISLTTLDDVFLKAGSLAAESFSDSQKGHLKQFTTLPNTSNPEEGKTETITGIRLTFDRAMTLFYKRMLVMKRSKYQVFIQFSAAIFTTVLAILLGANVRQDKPLESGLDLTLNSMYASSDVYFSHDKGVEQMGAIFKQLVTDESGIPSNVSSVSESLILMGTKNLPYYQQNLVVAAEFNSTQEGKVSANAMYSNVALHGAPISLNLVMNTILRFLMEDYKATYLITTTNEPLPAITAADKEEHEDVSTAIVTLLWLSIIPVGPLLFTVFFVAFPLRERVSKIKQLQLMTGVHPVLYWGTIYVWDMLCYIILTALLTILVAVFDFTDIFTSANALGTFFIIILSYGFSNIAFSYLFSYKKTASSGEAILIVFCYAVGIVGVPIVFVLDTLQIDHWENLIQVIKHLGFLVPHFSFVYACLGYSMKSVANYNWNNKQTDQKRSLCKIAPNPCCEGETQCKNAQAYFNFSSKTDVLEPVIFMLVTACLYLVIIVLLDMTYDFKWINRLKCLRHAHVKVKDFIRSLFLIGRYPIIDLNNENETLRNLNEPDDVRKEDEFVSETLKRNQGKTSVKLLVQKLKKFYKSNMAVDKVSFQVKSGECFGLLGVNGAGKSTTFKMLTWDELRCAGRAKIDNVEIDHRLQYLHKTGYCPQVDALNGSLSAKELLTVFAHLRGVPSKKVANEVQSLIDQLGLNEYQNNNCSSYSGGNKRKLNIAIALIGNPDVIFLDEPTTGVDPIARRKLWDILTTLKKRKFASSFVLTSHSMEECETLCDRLTIMAEGKLKCLGDIPHLKQKFQQGFTVMLKLKDNGKARGNQYDQQTQSRGDDVIVIMGDEVDGLTNYEPLACELEQSEIEPVIGDVKKLKEHFEKSDIFDAHTKDEHHGLLHYHIYPEKKGKSERWSWSELFEEMEDLKRTYPQVIEDYSLSDTTLEQIFLSFAKEKKD